MKGRQRGRNGGKPRPHHPGGHRNPNFEQNFGRMRGNAQQLMDKYLAMARDASQMGDRVAAENFFQHADHYYRVLNERYQFQQQQQQNNQNRFNGGRPYGDGGQQDGQNYQGQGYQGQGYQGQGGYAEQGPIDIPPPVSAHQPMMPVDQPHMTATTPPPHYQPQPQPNVDANGDIGLPPSLFGPSTTPQVPPQTQFVNDAPAEGDDGGQQDGEGGDGRGFRPRHGRRRRFRNDGSHGNQSDSA